jgi:predicted RNase H-like nuclease (RuvC/YqgF family)
MPKRKWKLRLGLWPTVSAVLAAFVLITGAVAAFTDTLDALEPWAPASRGYVVILIGEQTKTLSPAIQQLESRQKAAQDQSEIRQLQGQIQQIESQTQRAWGEQLGLKRDLLKAVTDREKDLLSQRIESLEREIEKNTTRKRKLSRQLEKLGVFNDE